MSKSIASYKTGGEKIEAIRRRLAQAVRGIGYWAAVDAARKYYPYLLKEVGKSKEDKSE